MSSKMLVSARTRRAIGLLLAVIIGCGFVPLWPNPVWAAGQVGDGTPASCTEAALNAALASSTNITFSCGGPKTIRITTQKNISASTTIDGGGLITLDGGGSTRILATSYNTSMTLKGLTFINGYSADNGGAVYSGYLGNLSVSDCTFNDNVSAKASSGDDGGGAIFVWGATSATISNSHFNRNRGASGGAVHNLRSNLSIVNSTFDNNVANLPSAAGNGGAIYSDGANGNSDVISVSNSTFTGNTSNWYGGAIFTYLYNQQTINIDRVTFSQNSATTTNGLGGAVYHQSGTLNLTNSTFNGNRAELQGGGLWVTNNNAVNVVNTTFWGNRADSTITTGSGGLGGGIAVSGGNVTLNNVTLTNNYASFIGGGIVGNAGNVRLKNTVVANNQADNGGNNWNIGKNCSSNMADGGNNLQYPALNPFDSNDKGCVAGIRIADPKFGTLGANGGPTQTVPLLAGSAAIDTGNNATCAATDQRGIVRPLDGDNNGAATCDIGAFEYQAATKLGFKTQPVAGYAGQNFSTLPQVQGLNATSQPVSGFGGVVTLRLKAGTGTSGAKLVGNPTATATGGVASFGGLAIDTPGTGYVLTASSPGLSDADSAPFNVATPPAPVSGYFHALSPVRIYDSRPHSDPLIRGGEGKLGAGGTRSLTVAGVRGIPANASAVVGNLTIVSGNAGGYLSLYPGTTWPGNSSINWNGPGQAIANFAIVQLAGGAMTARNSADAGSQPVDFIFDAVGYLDNDATNASYLHTVAPYRAFDSRTSSGRINAGSGRDIALGGSGVPTGAKAVVVNLTATETGNAGGYVSVYPKGTALPPESNRISSVNWNAAGESRANFAIVPLSTDLSITAYSFNSGTQFLVDVVGYLDGNTSGGSNLSLTAPGRIYDSRGVNGPLAAENNRKTKIGGLLNVPGGAKAAIVNLTAANTNGVGYLSLYPGNATIPVEANRVSSLNWTGSGQAVANFAIIPLDTTTGELKTLAGGNSTEYLIDVVGFAS